mmetsp:Transcript_41571/g.100112  ORF Transcript_41571/g.100112 Transcript_41571/m.100112 type:complete len:223 (-) Transcript_41571:50-718(-)
MSENKSVEFKLPQEEPSKPKMNQAPSSRSRSSFFKKLSQSFRRSNGEKGADAATLRGYHGADFESYADVSRGAIGYSCGCFGHNDTSKERFLMIKGAFCFVFKNEISLSAKYAIRLAHMKAKQDASNKDTVVLETSLGDTEYTFVFPNATCAKQFIQVTNKQASLGEIEEVRVQLGHEHLLNQSKSVMFAGKVARAKVNAQPPKKNRISPEEIAQMNFTPVF